MNHFSDTKLSQKLPDRKMTEQLIRERAAQSPATPKDGEDVAVCLPGLCLSLT
jgi:hypothetical protein